MSCQAILDIREYQEQCFCALFQAQQEDRELFRSWMHIIDLVVLKQFIDCLPKKTAEWVEHHRPTLLDLAIWGRRTSTLCFSLQCCLSLPPPRSVSICLPERCCGEWVVQ